MTLDLYIDDRRVGSASTVATEDPSQQRFHIPIPAAYQDNRPHRVDICVSGTLISLENSPATIILTPSTSSKHAKPAAIASPAIPPVIQPRPASAATYPFRRGSVEGKFERVDSREITGWVWRREQPDTPLTVEILADDTVIDRCLADRYRADLEEAGKGDGRHAFRLAWPDTLSDGKEHAISVRIEGSKHVLHPGPRRFTHMAERPYHTFEEYLRWAMLHRQISYPLQENDRRILAYMEGYRRRLRERFLAEAPRHEVTIIMPAYNRAGVIGEAVASVRAQSHPHWQLIIVDDASTDDTRRIAEELAAADARITLLALAENGGASAARNAGLARTTSEYIAYLDTDNIWHPDYLLLMTGTLAEQPEADCIYCAQQVIEHYPSLLHGAQEKRAMRFGPFHRALLENRNAIDLNVFLHRRGLWEREGGFHTGQRRYNDWELMLRYTRDKAPLALPCLLGEYRQGHIPGQISQVESVTRADSGIDALLQQRPVRLPGLDALSEHPLFHLTGGIRPVAAPRPVTIVIPSYEAPDYLRQCVAAIHAFTPAGQYEVMLVDNASGKATRQLVKNLARRKNVRAIYNERNMGFTWAVNQGIAAAPEQHDILLLNNDALVTAGWLQALQEVTECVPDAGIVVPRQVLPPQSPTLETHAPFCQPVREADVTLSAHHANILNPEAYPVHGFAELNFAPFFCAYITRECLRRAGPLDAEGGRHYRSDRLYCDTVRQIAGLRILYTPHAKLYHFLQQSTRALKTNSAADYQKIFVENRWDEDERKEIA